MCDAAFLDVWDDQRITRFPVGRSCKHRRKCSNRKLSIIQCVDSTTTRSKDWLINWEMNSKQETDKSKLEEDQAECKMMCLKSQMYAPKVFKLKRTFPFTRARILLSSITVVFCLVTILMFLSSPVCFCWCSCTSLLTADGDSQLHSRFLRELHVERPRTGDDRLWETDRDDKQPVSV